MPDRTERNHSRAKTRSRDLKGGGKAAEASAAPSADDRRDEAATALALENEQLRKKVDRLEVALAKATPLTEEQRRARLRQVFRMRSQGATYGVIAAELGVSYGRARALFEKAEKTIGIGRKNADDPGKARGYDGRPLRR